MKEFLLVFRLQLKLQFRTGLTKKQKLATPLALGLSMLPLFGFICFALYMLVQSGVKAGIVAEILVLIMSSAQIFTLFFVSKVYISTFYNAEDNEFLSTLPATPAALFLAKLSVVYLSELSFSAVLLLPTLITSAVAMNMAGMAVPVIFYFFIPLAVLFAPIIPLAIISIFAAPIMYFASFFKRRAAMSSIMSMLLFVSLMGAYFALIPNFSNISNLQNDLPQQAISIFKNLGNVMYFDKTFFLAAINVEFAKNFFITLGIIVGAFALSVLLSVLFFRRSISAQFETHIKNAEVKLGYKRQTVVKSLLLNDFKSLIRMPGFALNCFMNIFMGPILIIAMTAFSDGGLSGVPAGSEDLGNISMEIMTTGFLMMYCLMLNIGMNYVATVSFTREGQSFYFLKHLPVEFNEVLKAKRLFADITSAVGIFLLMLSAIFILKLNVLSVLAFGLVSIIFAMAFNMYGIYRDMKRPKFDWTNVNEALKRNNYIMIPFFISLGFGFAAMLIAIGFASLTDYIKTYWLLTMYWAIMLIVAIVMFFVFRKPLYNNAESLFDKMGEPQVPQVPKFDIPKKFKMGL